VFNEYFGNPHSLLLQPLEDLGEQQNKSFQAFRLKQWGGAGEENLIILFFWKKHYA